MKFTRWRFPSFDMPSIPQQSDGSIESGARPGVFLDRDGTIVHEANYLHRVEDMELYPSAAEAIRLLNQSGRLVVVVTNQSGVARGILSENEISVIHAALQKQLAHLGARIDRFYYCPHLPNAPVADFSCECECRKPNPGMVFAAARDLNIDLERSYLIGDKQTDIETAHRAGCVSVLVKTGYGASAAERQVDTETVRQGDSKAEEPAVPDYVANDLLDAVKWILTNAERGVRNVE